MTVWPDHLFGTGPWTGAHCRTVTAVESPPVPSRRLKDSSMKAQYVVWRLLITAINRISNIGFPMAPGPHAATRSCLDTVY